jgi:hypothetical protein
MDMLKILRIWSGCGPAKPSCSRALGSDDVIGIPNESSLYATEQGELDGKLAGSAFKGVW